MPQEDNSEGEVDSAEEIEKANIKQCSLVFLTQHEYLLGLRTNLDSTVYYHRGSISRNFSLKVLILDVCSYILYQLYHIHSATAK